MNFVVKLVLILFGLAYLISPVDIIPDILIPYLGWLDDGLVLWCVYYLIRTGQMPWFLFREKTSVNRSGPRSEDAKAGKQKPAGKSSGTSRPGDNPGSRVPEPEYEVLGLSPDASWKEIQAAYKERIKKYHPDKLNHLGEAFADLANEKFLEIQQAYESLKRKKGK